MPTKKGARKLSPHRRWGTRAGVSALNVVSLKPRDFTNHHVKMDTRTPRKRERWSNESKKKTPTRTGRVAHSSQELCIGVGSRSHETDSSLVLMIIGQRRPRQTNSPEMTKFSQFYRHHRIPKPFVCRDDRLKSIEGPKFRPGCDAIYSSNWRRMRLPLRRCCPPRKAVSDDELE